MLEKESNTRADLAITSGEDSLKRYNRLNKDSSVGDRECVEQIEKIEKRIVDGTEKVYPWKDVKDELDHERRRQDKIEQGKQQHQKRKRLIGL